MKRILTSLLILITLLAEAQYRWDAGINLGAANYLGEMGGNEGTRRDFVADMKLSQTRPATGAFVRYKFHPEFSAKINFMYGRISGADRLSTNLGRRGRNLSFRNDLYELSAQGEYQIYRNADLGGAFRYRNDFRAYAFIGIGATYSNPKANYNGEWISLRPLQTEAQKKPYSLIQPVIPTGVGFNFTLNRSWRIGWELGWRTTFTDYLDDVSTTFADPSQLKSPLSSELANRSDEIQLSPGFADNFSPGMKRGDPTHNDSYMFTTVNFSYVIQQRSDKRRFMDRKYGYLFKRWKYKKMLRTQRIKL